MKKLLQGLLIALLTFTVGCALVSEIRRPYVEQYCRETMLKQDLHAMRKAIDQYLADQAKLPLLLNDLVVQGYLREIPIDPMTGSRDWQAEFGEAEPQGKRSYGIVEVHSSADGKSSDGTSFGDF